MFGITLIILGALVLGGAILVFSLQCFYIFFKGMAELIGFCIQVIYDYLFITRKDKKTGYYQKQILRNQLEKESSIHKLEKAKREVVIGAMNFVTKMRVNYPYADEDLFQEAMHELPKDTCRKTMRDYEEMIRLSHVNNLIDKPAYVSSKTYSLVDLENLDPIEVRNEKPITMTLYQIDQEYILWVFNSQTDENTLLQTHNYSLMANYMITILGLQQNLKALKESIRSIQLENIFNVKKESANDYNNTNNSNRRW